jgi:hypothetical protein
MRKLKSVFAHAWAALATPIVLATFIGIPFFSQALAHGTGVKISPWFIGGEVQREIDHEGYRTILRRPVFDGLIGQRSHGFVQIEWQPLAGGPLPPRILEEIDYDRDGSVGFTVALETAANRALVSARSARVLGLERVYDLPDELVIRVALRRK